MGPEAFSRWLDGLSLPERAKLLVRISFELTILARGCYELDEAGHHGRDGKISLGFNELQHRILSQRDTISMAKRSAFIRLMSSQMRYLRALNGTTSLLF